MPRRHHRTCALAPRLRVPRVRAVPWGAVLDDRPGDFQILLYCVVLVALGYPLGIYMARVYSAERQSSVPCARVESGFYRLIRTDAKKEQDWKSYAKTVLVFSVVFCAAALRDPAAAGPPLPEPGSPEGRAGASVAEHDRQLHHEHELAVLRRRVHDVVPHADGRPRGAELRLRGRRHGRPRRGRARHRAPLVGHARQLLGRPLPLARLHPAAAAR